MAIESRLQDTHTIHAKALKSSLKSLLSLNFQTLPKANVVTVYSIFRTSRRRRAVSHGRYPAGEQRERMAGNRQKRIPAAPFLRGDQQQHEPLRMTHQTPAHPEAVAGMPLIAGSRVLAAAPRFRTAGDRRGCCLARP